MLLGLPALLGRPVRVVQLVRLASRVSMERTARPARWVLPVLPAPLVLKVRLD